MKYLIIIFTVLIFCSCTTTKIYIVRHAEKANTTANSELKDPQGFARANALKEVLKNIQLTAVYSTNYLRTIHTAEPTASSHTLGVTLYDNADSLADQLILKKNKTFLITGHSNTVPRMIRHLGLDPGFAGDIPDNDFDNLFVITVKWKGKKPVKSLVRKTYGVASP